MEISLTSSLKIITMLCAGLALQPSSVVAQEKLNGHAVQLDSQNKLISWVQPQDEAYARVVQLAWDFLINRTPVEDSGLKAYYVSCCLGEDSGKIRQWPHNPAGMFAMLIDSAVASYAYSGDRGPVELARSVADYQLAHGTTPPGWLWARVPYASSNAGAIDYRGADGFLYSDKPNTGDGYGVIEPDKAGELGYAYLQLFEMTGNRVYLENAIACADALAKNVRVGDAEHSPWPFRVNAETGVINEEYSSNVIGPIKLFAELMRINKGDVASYKRARSFAWGWMMEYPVRNQTWSGYFEDVYRFSKPVNYNQYSPMETARYLMEHPELDPDWRKHVPQLLAWIEKQFVYVDVKNEPGVQWGANAVSEQIADMNKMGSHTSRYASVNARWYELTGDNEAKAKAFRSFNWATYMCSDGGWVKVGPVDQSLWFSDGYGDYIRHFLAGMASVPEWAPRGENHLLKSSSVVADVKYGKREVTYSPFDPDGSEVLKLNFTPKSVLADGKEMAARSAPDHPGWSFDSASGVLRIQRSGTKTIRVIG